jgi:REP element-mobilizing transposase RayT
MTEKTPREIKYGNDFFREIMDAKSSSTVTITITYWDLWIAIILVDQFDNDLDEMISALRSKAKTSSYASTRFEGLLNHIHLLHQILSEEDLHIADILVETDADFIKKQKPKARKKILEVGFQPQEKSIWMIDTPKKLREDQAMRGRWHLFPVDPHKYANGLERIYKSSGFYSRYQSSILENKLKKYIDKYQTKTLPPELFALYRAFLAVIVEKMNVVDDSDGVIGDLYGKVFEKYFLLDRNKLDMNPAYFFSDLIELIVWEDYGLSDDYHTDFFKNLTSTEIPLVESILLQKRDELNSLELPYQEKKVLTMLQMLKSEIARRSKLMGEFKQTTLVP